MPINPKTAFDFPTAGTMPETFNQSVTHNLAQPHDNLPIERIDSKPTTLQKTESAFENTFFNTSSGVRDTLGNLISPKK